MEEKEFLLRCVLELKDATHALLPAETCRLCELKNELLTDAPAQEMIQKHPPDLRLLVGLLERKCELLARRVAVLEFEKEMRK